MFENIFFLRLQARISFIFVKKNNLMKKINVLILLIILFISGQAQNITLSSLNAKYRLGFNIGNLYQCSDVERLPGFGYGLTFEKILKPGSEDFFSFSLRARYLHGISKGLDYKQFTGILHNPALNGTRNSLINYVNSPGFVYNNFRTKITDFSGELMLYCNQLWLKTHILLYGWGGFSLVYYEATINALDELGNMYDYASINPGTKDFIIDQLKNMLDKKYESYADNLSKPENTYGPSAGIGLGIQLSKRIAIGIEHKTTWTYTDLLDGQQWDNNNQKSSNDDIYHYTVLGLKFILGGSDETKIKRKNKSEIEDTKRPQIFITTPGTNPYQSPDCKASITGSVTNLTSVQQLVIKENAVTLNPSEYFFRPETGTFKIERTIKANTEYQIIATNPYGSAIKFQHIHCSPKINKPVITIEKPQVSPFITPDCKAEITALIENIQGKEYLTVTENNVPIPATQFTFNENKRLIISKNIKDRSSFTITARNDAGTTSAEIIIDCRKSSPKPEIKITNPVVNPYSSPDCKADVRAVVTGITNKSQITITENGNLMAQSAFTFDPAGGIVRINKIISGTSTFVIKVENASGSASASTVILCREAKKLPIVEITNPIFNPFTSEDCIADITARIQNIDNSGQISVYEGSNKLSSSYYQFDNYSKVLKIKKLLSGSSTIRIVAENEAGTAEDEVEIKCIKKVPLLPKVNITEPKTNPFVTSNCKITIYAHVENIERSDQLSITENGFTVSSMYWNFNSMTNTVSIQKEVTGTSAFEIIAKNEAGSAKASITVKCDKKSLQPTITILSPQNNPYQTSDCRVNIKISTTNVSNKSQIMLKENGIIIPASDFSFDNNGIITLTRDFTGKNTIEIKVTTPEGSASTSLVIECLPKKLPPEIKLIEPTVSPFITSDCQVMIKFSVKYINNKSELTLTENGNPIPGTSWFYDAAENMVSFSKKITGQSVFELTAVTSAGKTSSKAIIQCQPQEQKLPKIVITYPSQNPFKTSDCNIQLVAVTTNVASKNQITIKENGNIISSEGFSFDPANGKINMTRNVTDKSNIEIKVTTNTGTAVASMTIECIKPIQIPTVKINEPTLNPYVSPDCLTKIRATITQVSNKSQITVKESNNPLPANYWNFDASTGILTLNKPLVGEQLYEIIASNTAGTASAKVTIKCQPKLLPPKVVITTPAVSPYVTTDCKINLIATTTNISQKNQITIKENGTVVNPAEYSYDASNQKISLTQITQ